MYLTQEAEPTVQFLISEKSEIHPFSYVLVHITEYNTVKLKRME